LSTWNWATLGQSAKYIKIYMSLEIEGSKFYMKVRPNGRADCPQIAAVSDKASEKTRIGVICVQVVNWPPRLQVEAVVWGWSLRMLALSMRVDRKASWNSSVG
jgi:hypothetical protein